MPSPFCAGLYTSLRALERLHSVFYMKTVLITGCSSGFGKEMVPLFLERGWRVIATMRNPTPQLPEPQLTLLKLDVTKPEDRKHISKYIQNELGGQLNCLINNAGYGLFGALEDLNETQIRQEMEVNFFGLALLTQDLLPFLRHSKGRIINLSSILGFWGIPLSSLYCASKFAVEGFSESLFHELKPLGIQVALVEPGGYQTGFMDKSVWGEKSDDPLSPYYSYTQAYKNVRAGRGQDQKTGPQASTVAKTCIRLAEMRKMPLRTRCKGETHLIYFLRWLLPEPFFLLLLTFSFSKSLKTK